MIFGNAEYNNNGRRKISLIKNIRVLHGMFLNKRSMPRMLRLLLSK